VKTATERCSSIDLAFVFRSASSRDPCRRRRYVYDTCMAKVRTNIEIEDDYVQAIMRRYHLRTKTEVVDLALRRLAGEPMTRDEALAMRGSHSIGEIPDDQSPHTVPA